MTYVTGRWWTTEFWRAACCCCMLARSKQLLVAAYGASTWPLPAILFFQSLHMASCNFAWDCNRLWLASLSAKPKGNWHLPASVSMPGVEACRYVAFGGVMRASRGEAACWAVLIVVCIALAPFAI